MATGWNQGARWVSHHRFPVAGGACLVLGFVVSIWLAYKASGDHPPSGSQSALFVFVSGALQVGAAAFFGRKKEPVSGAVVGTLLRRHRRLAEEIDIARQEAEAAFDGSNVTQMRPILGQLSVRLSTLQKEHQEVMDEWGMANAELLEVEEGSAT